MGQLNLFRTAVLLGFLQSHLCAVGFDLSNHYIAAKTGTASPSQVPWRDLALPLMGGVVCIGFWMLPAQATEIMFISGELPPGFWPAALALSTFGLILIWLIASFAYLVAILRRLTTYRAHIRQLYSDVEKRDLRGSM